MNDNARRIVANLAAVRSRIVAAAARAGRAASDVRLVAVTKYVGDDEVAALLAAGCSDFGESRPQTLWSRAERFRDSPARWHLIGHLQRNKVARTLPLAELIHSVDSPRLLTAIDAEAARLGRTSDVLLEVNVSGDASKHGVAAEGLAALVAAAAACPHVCVRGLMTMAAREGDADAARGDFARLRRLRDKTVAAMPAGTVNVQLDELSMGMSGDFEQAIAEGATLVRIGSALFEDVDLGRGN
ncbi:MAG: YggS family pyridoxal phosphate-dependent enzyme [Pirellulales bacterium]